MLFLATVVLTLAFGLFGAYSNGAMVVEGAADVIEGASRHSSATWKVTEDANQDRLDELQKDGTGSGMLRALGGAAKVVKGTTGLAGSPTTSPNPIGLTFGDGMTLADLAFSGRTAAASAPADAAPGPSGGTVSGPEGSGTSGGAAGDAEEGDLLASWPGAVRPEGRYACWIGEKGNRRPQGSIEVDSRAQYVLDGELVDDMGRVINIGWDEPLVADEDGWLLGAYYTINGSQAELTNGVISSLGKLQLLIDVEGEEVLVNCDYLEPAQPDQEVGVVASGGRWELSETLINPDGGAETEWVDATASSGHMTVVQLNSGSGRTSSVSEATWNPPPATLAPGTEVEIDVTATITAKPGAGSNYHSFTVIPQVRGGFWPGGGIGPEVACGQDVGCDQARAEETGTLTFDVPSGGDTFNFGVSALNCGGTCEVRYVYTWVG